jgi:hypothetical protein
MGANAQTSVPVFTSGQVLTAQQQTEINTGIPVFATTVTRDAAFGGTGEKTLAEGQFAFLEDTNTTQFYDGVAWQPVGGDSGLTLISTTTIGTTVASVTVSGAFSSTYDNYRIIVAGGALSVTDAITMTLGSTVTGYYRSWYSMSYAGTPLNQGLANISGFSQALSGTTNSLSGIIDLCSPNLAKVTIISSSQVYASTTGTVIFLQGFLNDTTQYTAFTLTPASGTMTGGTIKVYGYQNS